MAPPNAQEVRAALDKLEDDAKKWTSVAETFSTARGAADRLDLSALHFTYVGDKVGMVEKYRLLQETFMTLLQEGSTNFTNMAGVLRKVAAEYKADDEAGKHSLEGATY